jgi:polyisoprenoid-binding protein YceI
MKLKTLVPMFPLYAPALLACGLSAAQAAQLNPGGSEIAFTTRQMGVPVEGKFGKFSAQIALDPKKAEAGSVAFAIDTASARFGTAELDAETPKPVWLSAVKFPQATFKSQSIKTVAPGRYEVAGQLTIKGATQNVVVPVQLAQSGSTGTATGQFAIRRLDFKIGEGEWNDTSLLANEVQVRVKLALTGLPQ